MLTGREHEILHLVAHGLRTNQIAVQLGIAQSTVNSLVRSARWKLNARTRTHAAALVAGGDGAGTFAGTFRDLRLSHGAEVHLPIFGHGAASTEDNRALARQLLTPQEPGLGAPMGGAAADGTQGAAVAVAVFTIP
jgi:DNA-binding CsgD family transcriptional regulator